MSTENNDPQNEAPNSSTFESAETTDLSSEHPQGDKTLAMLCHLLSFVGFIGVPLGNILGPLVLWLVKKDQDAFVDATGKEVLNFQISVSIYAIVCGLLCFIVIGFVLLPILLIAVVIYTILGAMKANEGVLYRYPFTLRFIK